MDLVTHIKSNFNNSQSEFARAEGVHRQQVQQWITKGFIVVGGYLYSPRRVLKVQKVRGEKLSCDLITLQKFTTEYLSEIIENGHANFDSKTVGFAKRVVLGRADKI